jgi:hypothetical protein
MTRSLRCLDKRQQFLKRGIYAYDNHDGKHPLTDLNCKLAEN